jgi:peptidoglycan LD-endopeptidase LytH
LAILLVSLFVVAPAFSPATGMTLKESLTAKQKQLNAAYAEYKQFQEQMNVLADRQNQAEIRLAGIEDKIGSVQNNIDTAQADLEAARQQLNGRVVQMYKDGFSSAPAYVEVLFADADFSSVLERLSYLGKMADQDQHLFSQVQGYLQQKQAREADLSSKQQDQAAALADIASLQAEMNAKLKDATGDYQRLHTQVVNLREQVRKAEEAAKKAAALAALQRAKTLAAQKKANAALAAINRSSGKSSTAQPGAFVFPVAGPHSYVDSWGAARSGGRSHKGTDILAAEGTPCVACVSGTVTRVTTTDVGLGGITIWLKGNNGSSYYYAHLSSIAGGIHKGTSVSAGQVIGYVGHTGNAGTCNHLHFGLYPGSSPIDPYPTLRGAD